MPQLFDSLYKWATTDTVTAPKLNTRFQSLDSRLSPLEALKLSFDTAQSSALAELQTQASSVVQNLEDQLASLTTLNWLVSVSSTPLSLVNGAQLQLLVDPSDVQLFAPGPFSVLSRAGDPYFTSVVKTVSYVRATGTYAFTVLSQHGKAGTYNDWEIAAVAGSTVAQLQMLSQVTANLATITSLAQQVATNASTVNQQAANVAAINSRITISSLAPTGGKDGDIWFKV